MYAIIVIFFVAAVRKLDATGIHCEKIERFAGFKYCCFLNSTTVISAIGVIFADPENIDVDSILLADNKKIQYLPIKVHKKFPKLETYGSKNAPVKEISALNFEGLMSLKSLDLRKNQIKFIPNDCFEDLIKLLVVNLEDNRISIMNGVAFANLPRLVQVNLRGNICIDKLFTVDRDPNLFRRKISRNCASYDPAEKRISCRTYTVCDSVTNELFANWFNRTPGCCELDHGAYIDSPDNSFIADTNYASLEVLYVRYQRSIDFLPVLVHESFPLLKFYFVINTSVQKICKKNFEEMSKLVQLYLLGNQIEVIKSDTFDDLISLRRIYIMRHRLTALNGRAFAKLLNLMTIFLTQNNCIDKMFVGDIARENAIETTATSCGFDEFDSVEVFCERYQDYTNELGLSVESCIMTLQTTINATNFVIADLKDEEVEGIIFEGNKKIEYLPFKIYLQFPNLDIYKANRCHIKQISKDNFRSLHRLKSINLSFNQIKKISTDTFKGLGNLLHIYLIDNQIKLINGRTFDHLPLLTSVDLSSNECIDDKLEQGQSMRNFTRKIIKNCAFTETGEREFEKVFDIECGVGMKASGYVINGNAAKRGQWPFMAALMLQLKGRVLCGGNVITTSHVLTAAHCIQNKYQQKAFEASQMVILLGRHDISMHAEVGSEIRGIKEIKVHPHWNPRDLKYESDIAILGMDRGVQFSELIQPVCLTVEPEISHREAGFVVGWGNAEALNLNEHVPRQVLMSSVTTEVCFTKDFKLGPIFAPGMFCAGGDGSGPCHGDSGGGFFVKYHGLWTLRGVVSSGSVKSGGLCDVNRYTLFTNVLDYISWISDSVQTNATNLKPSKLDT